MTVGLRAFEHELLPVQDRPGPDCLSVGEAELLSACSRLRRGFCTRGYQSVRLANYAGILNIGGRMLEVLPKFQSVRSSTAAGRSVLLRLLTMAENLPVEVFRTAEHDVRGGSLLEAFITAFLDELAKLLRGGLLRRYQTWEEDLPMVRGRLLLDRQIRVHGMRPDRLACRFDEFSADNDWNRVLKTALGCIKPQISSVALRRRWYEIWPAFDGVAVLRESRDVFKRLSPDRQVRRYASAIRWARWIVSALTPNLRAGSEDAPGLLFDTNRLFEQAVARQLAIALNQRSSRLRLHTQVSGKYLARIGSTGMVGLRPDLVVLDGDRPVAVADTKWKLIEGRNGYLEPSPEDVYQLFAYAAAFRCPEVVLIYPWHEGIATDSETVFELPETGSIRPRLTILCVNVFENGLPIVVGGGCIVGKLLGGQVH